MDMIKKTWSATDAKRHFSEVLAGAEVIPQIVLLRGKPAGVVVSYERYLRSEKFTSQRSVSDWVRELEPLRRDEPEMEVAERVDRRDQFDPDKFGDEWE